MVCFWFLFPGVGGLEGDGDIYQPDNLLAFQEFVKQSTDDKGLHFMMADGVSLYTFYMQQINYV